MSAKVRAESLVNFNCAQHWYRIVIKIGMHEKTFSHCVIRHLNDNVALETPAIIGTFSM